MSVEPPPLRHSACSPYQLMWQRGKFFQKCIPFAYTLILLLGLAAHASGDEPKDQPTPDIESRILLLDRVYNRFIKAVAPSEANPLRWPENWWVGLGTEAEWTEAVHEWFKRNPRLAGYAQRGRENREAYAEAVRESSLAYNQYFGAQTDAAEKVYSGFLQFLSSQRRLTEQDRNPIEAEVLAKGETLKWMSGLSPERRLPFEKWREDPLIWEYYHKRKARHEYDTVQKDSKNFRRLAFENWKQQQLTALSRANTANHELQMKVIETLRTITHDATTPTYRARKDDRWQYYYALKTLGETIKAVEKELSQAEFDDPPQKLMAALAEHRESEAKAFSSALETSAPLKVDGPAAIENMLTDLAWRTKSPGWLPHYRPKLNWPLAPTPKDIVLGEEFGNALRSTPKWMKYSLISSTLAGALLGGVFGIATGLHAWRNASKDRRYYR